MNETVIEIVSFLIKKLLNDEEELIIREEEIVEELLELGYDIQDIDQAFELIYDGAEIIEEENVYYGDTAKKSDYNRIFSVAEKMYLPLKVRGLMIKLMASNYLSTKENEEIIIRAIQNSLNGLNTTHYLWNIVEEVVEDQKKLDLIYNNITEFNNIIPGRFKHIT